jgi:hypothetical protein
LQGSFNPEIFTVSLSQVVDHDRGKPAVTHALYTDAEQFFRDATSATEGPWSSSMFSAVSPASTVPQLCTAWKRHSVGQDAHPVALTRGFRATWRLPTPRRRPPMPGWPSCARLPASEASTVNQSLGRRISTVRARTDGTRPSAWPDHADVSVVARDAGREPVADRRDEVLPTSARERQQTPHG